MERPTCRGVGLRATGEVFEVASAVMRAAGVRRVEYEPDGSIAAVDFYAPGPETERAPPPSEMQRAYAPTEPATRWDDPHPELFDPDEAPSDKVAREVLAISRRAW